MRTLFVSLCSFAALNGAFAQNLDLIPLKDVSVHTAPEWPELAAHLHNSYTQIDELTQKCLPELSNYASAFEAKVEDAGISPDWVEFDEWPNAKLILPPAQSMAVCDRDAERLVIEQYTQLRWIEAILFDVLEENRK